MKTTSNANLQAAMKQLDEIAKKNPMQAQLILEQNSTLLYALVEAEYQLGMITEPVAGMDLLVDLDETNA